MTAPIWIRRKKMPRKSLYESSLVIPIRPLTRHQRATTTPKSRVECLPCGDGWKNHHDQGNLLFLPSTFDSTLLLACCVILLSGVHCIHCVHYGVLRGWLGRVSDSAGLVFPLLFRHQIAMKFTTKLASYWRKSQDQQIFEAQLRLRCSQSL